MRYLLYYPMLHVSKESHMKFKVDLSSLLEDEKFVNILNNNQLKSLRDVAAFTLNTFNKVWQEFFDFLKEQSSFDRLYLESYCNKSDSLDIGKDSVMQQCIDYVVESGANLEITESYFYNEGVSIFGSPQWLYNFFNQGREKSVIKNIRSSLKEGERGLLLFGYRHKDNLIQYLKKENLHLEVLN